MNTISNHILYISSIIPRQGTGGWIVILRHLKRLENSGWKISIAVPQKLIQSHKLPSSWKIIQIPDRRWWWLPVRDYLIGSLFLRILWWTIECEKALKEDIPNFLLTILGDDYNLLAKSLSHRWNIPMSLIIHDDLRLRSQNQRMYDQLDKAFKDIIKHSSKILIVSPEMKDAFDLDNASEAVSVLYPIPEGKLKLVQWNDEFSKCPVIAHAGSLYDFHVNYFQQVAKSLEILNGKLLIIAKGSNSALIKLQCLCKNIIHIEEFKENEDVINFLYDNATGMLVCYPHPVDQHEWTKTSFPSRLVEFSHLGVPILIIASTSTALGKWSQEHNWLSYLDNMDDDQLLLTLSNMTEKDKWLQMANQSIVVAQGEFNPEHIQAQFEAVISQ